MKKVATLVTLALSAPSIMGSCQANWITTAAGINSLGDTAHANAPWTGENSYATCATIKAGYGTCCSASEVATFQAKADALVEELENSVAQRDELILVRRSDVLAIKDSLDSITNTLQNQSNGVPPAYLGLLGGYLDMIVTFSQHFSELKDNFLEYQNSRVTCFNRLVQAQVSLWCAACLDHPYDLGVDIGSNTVSYGSTFTASLAGACTEYIDNAIEQSDILSLYYISHVLPIFASALKKAANGDANGAAQDLTVVFNGLSSLEEPTETLEKVARSVGTCTTTSCDWITTNLYGNGILERDLAVVGGSITSLGRLLQDESPDGRMLQSLNIDPETEAVGITVNFPANPGNLDNDVEESDEEEEQVEEEEEEEDSIENPNSALRNGAVACAITSLVALL